MKEAILTNDKVVAVIGGALRLPGDITPAQITANQNNYNPTGLADASVVRASTDASRNITGLAGGEDGRIIMFYNVGSQDIVFKNEDSNSTAANRFLFGADFTLTQDKTLTIQYDATVSRWRILAGREGGDVYKVGTPADNQVGVWTGNGTIEGSSALTFDGTDLATTENFKLGKQLHLQGDLTPAQITADQNNYNPTNLANATILRLDTDNNWTITGLQGGADGRIITVVNKGSKFIYLAHESGSSTAANRFWIPGARNQAIYPNQSAILEYDSTDSRWRVIATTPVSGLYDANFGNANDVNIDSVSGSYFSYTLNGDVVTVAGVVYIDPTLAATATKIVFELPIPTSGGCAGNEVAGMGVAIVDTTKQHIGPVSWYDDTHAQFDFISVSLSSYAHYIHFQYRLTMDAC